MSIYEGNGWTQDELNEVWERLREQSSYIHKILRDESDYQSMRVHTPTVAPYSHDEESKPMMATFFRAKHPTSGLWSEWIWGSLKD